jgi:DNA-3-methyladenine glycosylase
LISINFADSAPAVAQRLIGVVLLYRGVGGVIVETEAYDESEAASHAYRGATLRNAPLYGTPGGVYVYRAYGLHWCLNIVCREVGHAAGVLLRAIEPTTGIAVMRRRRGRYTLRDLCSGPGKIGQALAISDALNGSSVLTPPFALSEPTARPPIVRATRIGISQARERRWRFGLRDTPFASRPF